MDQGGKHLGLVPPFEVTVVARISVLLSSALLFFFFSVLFHAIKSFAG